MIPMLCEPIDEAEAERLLVSTTWFAERKYDGERLMIEVTDGAIVGYNRSGKVTTVPKQVNEAFTRMTRGHWVFDGELVKNTYCVFDLVVAEENITPYTPYERRRDVLEAFWPLWDPGQAVILADCVRTVDEKRGFVEKLKADSCEGYVLKRADSAYRSGHRKAGWKKVKFWKDVDVVISEVGREGKENAVMVLLDPDRGIVEVGTVSTLGKGEIKPGDVVAVKYLYVVSRDRPHLVQPSIIRGRRADKDMSECTLDQLEGSYTNKEIVLD